MGNVEIPNWLKGLPLAPEYHPTDTEFADPIAYISKIEKEASAFGICKIIPPLPKPSKKYVMSNLNKSLSKCPELGYDVDLSNACSSSRIGRGDGGDDGETRAVFTTRHQELGQSAKRTREAINNPPLGAHKQVWQSGEIYTLEQFESKSKAFARNLLGMIKEVSPLVIEAMFWKAASEKPIYVEYANDVPGSGFGESEGQFRYSHRHRRKRASYRRMRESSDCKKNEMDIVRNAPGDKETKDGPTKNDPNTCLQTPKLSITSSTSPLDEASRSSRRKSVNSTNDMEGSAGWKLSNSPWNLQVIARSPGSLTRFMPDDIPGVTSPMVYIGMLFSWFAWHVEDHELHSMNFLHTGSPKTWYAVPGDYAFAFEEVIRAEAYGSNVDRLAALTLLGEKTTLLSPQIVVASGIPCCRLIQNPGEFVVTFPRAYHVGFSHGFNCGEAANFGTPQWLKVAKEAAVRRAAMNYLPMLSHQQLLYLLTMSFVSRVPRSLLPGARNSRLRDRQKEERELLVKKAFIDDMLSENKTLSILLGRQETCRTVLWDPDLLPCQSKEPQLAGVTAAVSTTATENISHEHSESNNNKQNNLFEEMSLYMETLNDLHLDDDDLLTDFQVDSGTLACVACGILGFPFMSVVQPSERALIELPADNPLVQERPVASEPNTTHLCPDVTCTVKSSVSGDLVPDLFLPIKQMPTLSLTKYENGWNTSCKYLRPRFFCLEHTVKIQELLQSKGGAKILVICHRDYQKIKANATAIAEEISGTFNYNDVPLENASQEDLNLIDLAIDDEHDECGEDWTSNLGINLRYCVKVRKNSPSKQVQQALALGGLFSDKSPKSTFLNMKWRTRRSRSKVKLIHPSHCKPCENMEVKTDEQWRGKLDGMIVRKEEKVIQYSRRNKLKTGCSSEANRVQGYSRKLILEEVSATICGDFTLSKKTSESNLSNDVNSRGNSARLGFSPVGMSEMQNENLVVEATRGMRLNYSLSRIADSLATAANVVGSLGQTENLTLEVLNMEGKPCNLATGDGSEVNHEIKEMQREEHITYEACDLVSEEQNKELADWDMLMNQVSDPVNSVSLHSAPMPLGSSDAEIEGKIFEKSCMKSEVCDCVTFINEVQQEMLVACPSNDEELDLSSDALINKPTPASAEESCEGPREICAAEDNCNCVSFEDKVQQETRMSYGSNEGLSTNSDGLVNQATSISLEENFEVPRELSSAKNWCYEVTSENEVLQQEIQTTNRSKEELVSSSITQMDVNQPILLVEECSEVPRGTCAEEDLCADATLVAKVQQDIQTTNGTKVDALVSSSSVQMAENQQVPASVGACSEVPRTILANEKLSGYVTGDNITQENNQISSASNNEVPISSSTTPIDQPTPAPIQRCSKTLRQACSAENFCNGNEICLLGDNGNTENIKFTMVELRSNSGKERKRKREADWKTGNNLESNSFVKSPCEGLRPRVRKDAVSRSGFDVSKTIEEKLATEKVRKPSNASGPRQNKQENMKSCHRCDLEGCRMRFETKEELRLHKRNICPHEGCGKKFRTHRYAILHQRVHDDDRPLKCPWKGCSMTFKWAWARTEHIRVHTGERPYKCKVEGCGLSFRFVSDFSRHRRKTGHYVNSPA